MIRSFYALRHLLPFLFGAIVSPGLFSQTLPPDFSDGLVMGGFNEPVGATWDANGRTYVWEKRGMVWIVENGVRLPDPLIDLRQEVGNWRDYGFLGFTLDPNFLVNGHIYMMYVVDRHHLLYFGTPQYSPTANLYNDASIIRITRYTAVQPSLNTVDPTSRFILLGETAQTGAAVLHDSHGPGTLAFGTDGTLLASIGDGASYYGVDSGSAPETYFQQGLIDGIIRPEENVGSFRAQMVNSLNGKILRLDPATGNGLSSNPWYDPAAPRAARSRVWAMGLRNTYRFTVRPMSGSTDPTAGDPGSIYMGDVGWNIWEELNVCDRPGMNFGWPLFEGMDVNTHYWNEPTANLDTPNPLFNGVSCTQEFFHFQDLIVQETLLHSNLHPNPCAPSAQIPNTIPRHIHARPQIDWRHGNQSRTKGFLGNVAISHNLNDPNSPVPGPSFGGFAAIGGPWMEGQQLPLGYQGASFHGDYAMGFIRRFMFNEQDKPVSVHDFASGLGAINWIGGGPDGCIWYMRYNTSELRRICYDLAVDLPPTAVAEQSVEFGASPLTVTFTGSNSSDPNGPVTWFWDLGDGTTSTQADPVHVYTAPAGVPTTYNVVLTVTDNAGQTASTQLIVSVNNTPPDVEITSFPDGMYYPVGTDTLIQLVGTATDAEYDDNDLVWSWQVTLHHNTHTHPEPPIIFEQSTAVIGGVGCDGELYSYEISLTVTDPGGLSTTVTHWLYPACHQIAPTAVILADPVVGLAPLQVQFDGSGSYDPGQIVSYLWNFGDGTTSTDPSPTHVFTALGSNQVTLTVTDDDGLTGQAVLQVHVITLDPPQCMGPVGGVLREKWTGITGSTVDHLLSSSAYQGPPNSTSMLPSFQAPQGDGIDYGARIRGYIIPQVTGSYTFTVTSDDASVVYLSQSADPAFKEIIAHVPGYTMPAEFDKFDSQVSGQVQLQAGGHYYVEVLHKQGNGGDHFTLWWQSNAAPQRVVIPGSVLAPWEDCAPGVQLRLLLQGPLDPATGLMRDDLRVAGLIPQTEPYTALGMLASGGGDVAPAGALQVTGQNAVVDWVLVELRSAATPATVVAARAALLQMDGDVIGADGHGRLLFDVPAGQYHVAVRHRNHLGAMTASPVLVNASGATVDLTSTATWGEEAQVQMPDGRRALWMGNVVGNDALRYTGAQNDREPILEDIGGIIATNFVTGYYQSDTNMDGVVKYAGPRNDRDPILVNIGGVVPTAVRWQQLP